MYLSINTRFYNYKASTRYAVVGWGAVSHSLTVSLQASLTPETRPHTEKQGGTRGKYPNFSVETECRCTKMIACVFL